MFHSTLLTRQVAILLTFPICLIIACSVAFAVEVHPGFEEGVSVGPGLVQSSVGLGDIDQDGLPEIVVGGRDGNLYAYNGDGTPVLAVHEGGKGLGLTPGVIFRTISGAPILSSPTLADVDLDYRVDMFWGTDAGELFHLELNLSSDPEIIGDLKNQDAFDRWVKARPYTRGVPVKGEEDDTGE